MELTLKQKEVYGEFFKTLRSWKFVSPELYGAWAEGMLLFLRSVRWSPRVLVYIRILLIFSSLEMALAILGLGT